MHMLQTARQLGGVWWLLTSIWFQSVHDELLPTIPNRADCRRSLLLPHLVSFEFEPVLEDDRLVIWDGSNFRVRVITCCPQSDSRLAGEYPIHL